MYDFAGHGTTTEGTSEDSELEWDIQTSGPNTSARRIYRVKRSRQAVLKAGPIANVGGPNRSSRSHLLALLSAFVLVALTLTITDNPTGARAQTTFVSSPYASSFVSVGYGPIGVVFDTLGNLYVADQPDGHVYKFPPGGGVASSATQLTGVLNSPTGIAVGKDGDLYVAASGSGEIEKIDPSSGSILGNFASGLPDAHGIVFDPLTSDLFVSEPNAGTGIFKASADGTVRPYSSFNADGIAVAPDGTLFASGWGANAGQIAKISGTGSTTPGTWTAVANVPNADGIAVGVQSGSSMASTLWVNRNDRTITEIDLTSSPAATTDIITGGSRGDFDTLGTDGCLYATQSDSVIKVTAAGGSCPFGAPNISPSISVVRAVVLEGLVNQTVRPAGANGQAASSVAFIGETSNLWQAANYSASVDWGDGTPQAPDVSQASVLAESVACPWLELTLSLALPACFDVQPPPHAYGKSGVYKYTVHLQRSDGASATVSGETEVSPIPTIPLTTNAYQSRTGILSWPLGSSWFGCTATVVRSLSRDLVITAAHCNVPSGPNLWFAPGFTDSAGVCPFSVFPDLTRCPASNVPNGVWIGGTVVKNPAFGSDSGYGASNDQTFIQLDGKRYFGGAYSNTPVEGVVGGDFMDIFYWQLTQPLTYPMPIGGSTFGYPIDSCQQTTCNATQLELAQMLQLCANKSATQVPTVIVGVTPPDPGFALSSCSYHTGGSNAAGVSGSPYLTNDGPLANAVGAVQSDIFTEGKQFGVCGGVPGLIAAFTYLKADGLGT